MNYRDALREAAMKLEASLVPDPQTDAWYLMEYCCGISRTEYLLSQSEQMPETQYQRYLELTALRSERIPLQHITGEQEFMGISFQVSDKVLIPRQDTEILVEQALKICRDGMKVLDLCTGSGCIAISIASFCKGCSVTASDISDEALEVAAENAERNHSAVTFVQSNLFEEISETYDLIVSNPPYIPAGDIEGLMPEVGGHEPMLALDGGEDGLDFYRIITEQSDRYLRRGGWLMFEIGCEQGDAVAELMRRHHFEKVTIIKDLAGLDRVVSGRLKESEESYV